MVLLAGSLNGLQVGLFIFVCFVLAGTIWLFLSSMDSLKKLQEDQRQQYSHLMTAVDAEWDKPSWISSLGKSIRNTLVRLFSRQQKTTDLPVMPPAPMSVDLSAVKQVLQQQQQLSQKLLTQIDQMHRPQAVEKQQAIKEAKYKIEELELLVEQKDEEIQQLQAQQNITEKLTYKLEQVQHEFACMQERVKGLEQQATQAARLAVELEDSKAAYVQLTSELYRKSEKVQQVILENTQLHQQLAEAEDKLQEANFQRQQLFKKVKLLEEVNSELQSVTDTNQKLKTELRRIGELESMLNMIIEERNQLLRK